MKITDVSYAEQQRNVLKAFLGKLVKFGLLKFSYVANTSSGETRKYRSAQDEANEVHFSP